MAQVVRPRFVILALAVIAVAVVAVAVMFVAPRSHASSANGDHLESVPLAARSTMSAAGTMFHRLTADQTGVDFVHRWAFPDDAYDVETQPTNFSGAACIADYDGDGRPDIFLTRPVGGNRLYRNLGNWRFEDVTKHAGLAPIEWSMCASFGDVDNDGDPDLYVCVYDRPNRLYINQGDGTFVERAAEAGLDFVGSSVMMLFADYDVDGDLDGYLLTNQNNKPFPAIDVETIGFVPEQHAELVQMGVAADGTPAMARVGQYDRLYRNNGDGTFTEVSKDAGIAGADSGLSATWWDYNDDGLPDLYVANDYFEPDHLYRNNGDGTFEDVILQAVPHTPWFSMGSDAGDINNDGMLDFLASDMSSTSHYRKKVTMGDMSAGWFLDTAEPRQYMRNALYVNTGTGRFMEGAYLAGLADSDWTWSTRFADFDNDGRLDLFISNGMSRDWTNADLDLEVEAMGGKLSPEGRQFWLSQQKLTEENLAFRNLGDFRFENVGAEWGLDQNLASFGATTGDLDGDGDLDLVVNNFEEQVHIYRNDSPDGHRVVIRLHGEASNRHGVGATLRVENGDDIQVRYITLAGGFSAANEPAAHFGLGDRKTIERLSVRWPSGHRQVFENLPADRLYTIREPQGRAPKRTKTLPAPTLFAAGNTLDRAVHREREYNDYDRQFLLPYKLSQLGPGMSWGDVDGDGDEDLYLGAAAGQVRQLQINQGDGQFRPTPLWASEDEHSEDMASLFFDADADGDLDLFVVSGGVECDEGDTLLRDRLYLNDGKGRFSKSTESLPEDLRDSGGVAAAADFDRDGDLDLFVGGRSIPGRYPLTPQSRLLRNDGGVFTDVTDQVAVGLRETGLVTSAVWSDADDDGWIDLLVTHEWGPVKLFANRQGQLVDRTDSAGLAARLGWWNSIAAGDLDADGDIDYVVTNLGLNTKYQATQDKPLQLYAGDFEGDGKLHLIEAKFEEGSLVPLRGRSCSSNAMPFVARKFPTYHKFAIAPLQEIYTEECLAEAHTFTANTLESGVLLNDGAGNFEFQPLPRLAQISPGYGVVLTEVDGDGDLDLYMVQNFFGPQRETGRMDGGVSLLMLGNGDGTFEPVWPKRSGLLVPGDATALTCADLNGDGWTDFVVAINDGPVHAFVNRGDDKARMITVRLQGRHGNTLGAGARVRLQTSHGRNVVAEVYAGGGYLSQSTADLTFALAANESVKHVEVRWPDGRITNADRPVDERVITLRQPD